MNKFGGNWTMVKIEILVEYAKAYLTIMNKYPWFKLLYFDGFAGSGFIAKEKSEDGPLTMGAARRIIEINEPKPFDRYYFVEKNEKTYHLLKANTQDALPEKPISIALGDCNQKMLDMAAFLRKSENRNYRTLAYIDPYGMQLQWKAIAALNGLGIDMWVLVPTGMGLNRLLKNDGQISDAWLEKLEIFLGMKRQDILAIFYSEKPTLFQDYSVLSKEQKAIKKSAELYRARLSEVFTYVSQGYELRNSTNSIMYHLYFASNNNAGVNIANDIVRKYNN
jgi:three-Cys-motif partner protein